MTIKFAGITKGSNNFVGVVGAGVVNDNQFPVGIGLRDYRVDGLGDVRSRVIAGHDYGDEG